MLRLAAVFGEHMVLQQGKPIAVFGEDPRRFESTVQEILKDEQGRVRAVKLVRLNGREAVPGSEEEIPCDLLLIAAGFVGCAEGVTEAFGVKRTARGLDEAETQATSVPGVFCAGDMRRGPSLVVWGISEGRSAEREIDEYIMGYPEL